MGIIITPGIVRQGLLSQNAAMRGIVAAIDRLQTKIREYINEGGLEGDAFDAHKAYMETRHLEFLGRYRMALEGTMEANDTHRNVIDTQLSSHHYDEAKIESEISRLEWEIRRINNSFTTSVSNLLGVDLLWLQRRRDDLSFRLDYVRDKLSRLHSYLAATSGLYFSAEGQFTEANRLMMVLETATRCPETGSVTMLSVGEVNELQTFKSLVVFDANGNITDVDWDALEQKDPSFVEYFLEKFFINTGAAVAAHSTLGQGLARFLNNYKFTISGETWKLFGFEVTPRGLEKAIGNGIIIIGAAINFVEEIRSGENVVNATLNTAGVAGIAWGAKTAGTVVGKAAGTATVAALGAKKGAIIGTFIPIPVLGTLAGVVVGAAVGAVIGTIGTGLFKNLYNNHVRERVDNFVDNIGQGIRGLFSNLGSAFGG